MPVSIPQDLQDLLSNPVLNLATLWKLERLDGVKFFFTDHDCALPYKGDVYLPAGGTSATARQSAGSLQPANMELQGIIDSDLVTEDDLAAGKYRGAKATEVGLFWDRPDRGPLYTRIYFLDGVSYTGELWVGSMAGIASLFGRPIGGTYSRGCPYIVGDADCTATVTVRSGTVSAAIDGRRRFTITGFADGDGTFDRGLLTWTSGANNGAVADVRTWASGVMELQLNSVKTIVPGDTFTVSFGCDGRLTTCQTRFGNSINFGGYPTIPGTDRVYAVARNGQ